MIANTQTQQAVIIVGGGLSGLAAAALLARAGLAVTVFEKASAPGGRAISRKHSEFYFNQGAHAFYLGGPGEKLLNELGIHPQGSLPERSRFLALEAGKVHKLPTGVSPLLSTTLLKPGAKVELARLFIALRSMDLARLHNVSLQDWLAREVHHPQVRKLILALVHVTTFTNAPERLSAGLAITYLTPLVRYLDHGWQTLIDSLRRVAEEAGARIVTRAKVAAIEAAEESHTVRLANGTAYPASAVLLAVDPQTASSLIANGTHKELRQWAAQAIPLRVACFDVALRRLPNPHHLYVLGIDQALYYSVHSAWAALAPQGGALIHTMKYFEPEEPADPKSTQQELEALLDTLQPGWRDEIIEKYFLPHMLASNALVEATQGGLPGRPGPAVPGIRNLYIAGDWVGPQGQLTDACLASARQAANLIMTTQRAEREKYAIVD
ncbi:NAD(P)/FAD-dependent oxidoreductase [Ktedonosporobacter rubrisoli]|uniref:NAD(P)/FAD-dependent oxidoreductase n=1 Tax=Ktedonosporobacter rubrisoli TaxID=2509675 RepID=A0A4P6JLF4_KTERU|nr:FAD-dependent oxidoreductase [Ktedonosporobacter rubrisoli]QBD76038.1 NAD(P)/FAD-dependent oxidoreductase [Ktedonosporobacter rubrisoli]